MITRRAPAVDTHLDPTRRTRAVRLPVPNFVPPRRRSEPNGQLSWSASKPVRRSGLKRWLSIAAVSIVALTVSAGMALAVGLGLIYADGILPGIYSGGVALGGMSPDEAALALHQHWQTVTLRDGERTLIVNTDTLGVVVDALGTAQSAYEQGRSVGGLDGLMRITEVAPLISVNPELARAGLSELAPHFEQAPVNAGVRLVEGHVEPTEAVPGRVIDIDSTLALLERDAASELADSTLDLVASVLPPAVTDASAMVEQASRLLASPLQIQAFDPVNNEWLDWSLSPETWGAWLEAEPDDNSPTGLALRLNAGDLGEFANAQSQSLGATRYLDVEQSAAAVEQAVANGDMATWLQVRHHDLQHTVQSGESIISIAYDYGIPYPWLQAANPDAANGLNTGQTLTIPSYDNLLPLPVIPNKRIVVSISQQRTWVYENGALKWEWLSSTGIASSPTWPGIYQIQSHEPNAYAGNWNLWMPYFMGVYRPIPQYELMNGFHGFPTRGGNQLLWTSNLGGPVTYGCILLSSENAELLYNWAEEGVVVEIHR